MSDAIGLTAARLPNATLDKAIPEDQIRKVNGGSALAVALPMISGQRKNLLLMQQPFMKVEGS